MSYKKKNNNPKDLFVRSHAEGSPPQLGVGSALLDGLVFDFFQLWGRSNQHQF